MLALPCKLTMSFSSPNTITVISKEGCKYCTLTKDFLEKVRLPFDLETLDPRSASYGPRRTELIKATGQATFPWIFIGDTFVGGYHNLLHAYNTLRLEDMVKAIGLELELELN